MFTIVDQDATTNDVSSSKIEESHYFVHQNFEIKKRHVN